MQSCGERFFALANFYDKGLMISMTLTAFFEVWIATNVYNKTTKLYFFFNLNQINIFHYWNIRSEFRGSCARVWQHQSYYENALSSTLLMYSTLIASVDFYLFYNGTVDMQIRSLLTRGPWRVYDTLVSVKPWLGLFLFMFSVVCNNVWVRKCTVICIHQILFR